MIHRWNTLETSEPIAARIFSLGFARRQHPENGLEGTFTCISSPDWVNIIPITPDGKIVCVRQYRHGNDSVTLEIPGGLIETGEKPLHAAMRECIEETGYRGEGEAVYLGTNEPNPAFMNNVCHTFLWKNCKLTEVQNFDEHEEIEIELYTPEEIRAFLLDGTIRHSMVLTAFLFYFLRH